MMTILLTVAAACGWCAFLLWMIVRADKREQERARLRRLGIVHGHKRGTRFESEGQDYFL